MVVTKFLNAAALGFFVTVITIVFWQIQTDFKEQGIASGGPYDNAASFPAAVAFIIGILLLIQFAIDQAQQEQILMKEDLEIFDLVRAGLMLAVFSIYLLVLTSIGYHLATAPMIFAIMCICGMRRLIKLFFTSIAIATTAAFVFEVFLNVVLPLGIWTVYIPW